MRGLSKEWDDGMNMDQLSDSVAAALLVVVVWIAMLSSCVYVCCVVSRNREGGKFEFADTSRGSPDS